MKPFLLFLFGIFLMQSTFSQKQAYIPAYLRDATDVNGAQFSWDKTYQDSNFIIIWGNTVGTDPKHYSDPNLAFDPVAICDTMEYIYSYFKKVGLLDDSPGTNVSKYKFVITMYGTFGPDGIQGYADGGAADNIIGDFRIFPNATYNGFVIAHEFTHSLQVQTDIDYRPQHGLGSLWWNDGSCIWECHAEFMACSLYPWGVAAWGMNNYHVEEWGDWKNTYVNYPILMSLLQDDGMGFINRIWRESYSQEMPMQTIKRLTGLSQSAFNDKMYRYVRRMPTFDFTYNNFGTYLRQYRSDDMLYHLGTIQNIYNILAKVPGSVNRYYTKMEQAPEEFAYNVVPLYPTSSTCDVIVKFKGHTEVNSHSGWRYGFVTEKADGTVSRYSTIYNSNTSVISFKLQGGEKKLYLVVMGAPNDSVTIQPGRLTWDGYPKKFKFPYEITIKNAVPEGYQKASEFRKQLKVDGHIHSNGGGWVANSASVASSVYVDSTCMVLGNSKISGKVKIMNTAYVANAVISGNVQVLDNAFINGGYYRDNIVIKGQAYVGGSDSIWQKAVVDTRASISNYHLYGNIEVGGDALTGNDQGRCNNGAYYVLTNFYDNQPLPCDGRTATYPGNVNINNTFSLFSASDMALSCNCTITPECISSTLPVTWLSFTVAKGALNNSALLNWKVANSINNNHFEVEKSINGLQFTSLANVSAGKGAGDISYTYADNQVSSNKVYYRIKQVDNDGKFSYTNIIPLSLENAGSWTVAPNPARDQTMLLFNKAAMDVHIVLIAGDGRVVYKEIVPAASTGSTYSIPLNRLAKGVYILQVETGSEIRNEKIIKN